MTFPRYHSSLNSIGMDGFALGEATKNVKMWTTEMTLTQRPLVISVLIYFPHECPDETTKKLEDIDFPTQVSFVCEHTQKIHSGFPMPLSPGQQYRGRGDLSQLASDCVPPLVRTMGAKREKICRYYPESPRQFPNN